MPCTVPGHNDRDIVHLFLFVPQVNIFRRIVNTRVLLVNKQTVDSLLPS